MTFTITQNDSGISLSSVLTDDNEPVDLTGVSDVSFNMEDQFERVVISDTTQGRVNIVDKSNGVVEYVFGKNETNSVGTYYAEWQVTYSSGFVETFPTNTKLQVDIVEEIA